ncbi:hypothetical protein ABC733_17210 [Mangrovibacter sp. SLW1]
MKLIIWFSLFFVAVFALLLIRKYTKIDFVGHAGVLHKTWSVRLNALAFTLGGCVMAFPDAVMHAWNVLPPDIKSTLPPNIMQYISYALIGASVLSQYVRQKSYHHPGISNDRISLSFRRC